MDIRKIKKLIELLENTDVSEIEISEGEESVRITRPTRGTLADVVPVQSIPVQSIVTAQPNVPSALPPIGNTAIETPALGVCVLSPMVGTFYSAANPDSDAFVKVGQKIKIGDPVCIVEAMKMFNKIESEVEGTIKSILVSDGDPVEFDQPLFEVE